MAKDKPPTPFDFTGMEETLATYADTFVVGSQATGMYSLFFFQVQLPTAPRYGGRTEKVKSRSARCVARIVLAEKAMDGLLRAMAKHRGFALQPIAAKEQGQQEAEGEQAK